MPPSIHQEDLEIEAEETMQQRKELVQRIQQADPHESSQVSQTGMYQ